jgi:amino acid transporter
MPYFREVAEKAFGTTWDLVFERSILSAIIGLTIFAATVLLLKRRRKGEEAKLRLQEWFEAAVITACVFLVIWAANFLVFTPKKLVEQARSERDTKARDKDTEINRLKGENERLKQSDRLGAFLEHEAERSRKGSLSNRATILAKEISDAMTDQRKKEDDLRGEERIQMLGTDDALRQRVWNEMSQKQTRSFEGFEQMFNQRFTPRILIIVEELKANDLTDPYLDQWVQHPNTGAYTYTLTELSVALSKLALKMEEKEKSISEKHE